MKQSRYLNHSIADSSTSWIVQFRVFSLGSSHQRVERTVSVRQDFPMKIRAIRMSPFFSHLTKTEG